MHDILKGLQLLHDLLLKSHEGHDEVGEAEDRLQQVGLDTRALEFDLIEATLGVHCVPENDLSEVNKQGAFVTEFAMQLTELM